MVAIGAFGALSFGAWAQPYFNATSRNDLLYIAYAFAAIVPVLAVLAVIGEVATGHRPRPTAPFVLATVALLGLVAATVAGAVLVTEPLDLLDTTFATGQMNLTLLSALVAGLAGVWFWLPKISGSRAADGLGMLAALVSLGGISLVALGDLASGLLDEPAVLTGDYSPRDGVEVFNLVSGVGFALVLAGLLLAALALLAGVRKGLEAAAADRPDDPWGAQTLEWATTSPPPWNNFAVEPGPVLTASPLLDAAEEGA